MIPRIADYGRRPIPRWVGATALVVGLTVNEFALERTVVPDGEIGATVLRAAILAFNVVTAGSGLWILLRRPRSRVPWNKVALAAASAVFAWFAAFAVVDTQAPGLLRGAGVPYFELRARYRADPDLVMVPRRSGHEENFQLRGDLHTSHDDMPDPGVAYRASYNEWGFRTNSSDPPFDALVIGDSFVEIGESDSTTVSEMLGAGTGLSPFNLGRAWYGPHQYAELLRRHGPEREPDLAVLFFFEGNDAEDALEYEEWRDGGSYHHFGRAQGALWERFGTATFDLVSFVQWEVARHLGLRPWLADLLGHDEPPVVQNTGRVAVGGDTLRMKFGYWPDSGEGRDAGALRHTPRWRAARRALERFRDTAEAHGIAPVVIFLPTKATTYAGHIVEAPGRFSDRALGDPEEKPTRAAALAATAGELGIAFLDLTADFRRAATEPPLLYWPQDTHWSPRGRRIAAEAVGTYIRESRPHEGRTPDVDPTARGRTATTGGRTAR